ncbi:hypothetical protein [Klebsiella pneumoniae]|uniref:hypothetical protein n=1 Tax=Klebsiella pneumoniae TaxID=573 RepID=UPI001967B06E|nr:hypothetical protein [Klebsiella pneumoniae]
MMISREATMLSSRLAVLLSAFYHRLIIAHEASSFTAMQDRANAANDVSDAIPQRLPGDLQSVLVGESYEYQVKELLTKNILRLLILKDNLKEHYHIFMV